MLRTSVASLVVLALGLSPATAQEQDIGLTLDRLGQICGTVTCAPIPVGTIARGSTGTVFHYSAVVSPYVVAIGLPGPCVVIPGLGNSLLLGSPIETLSVGTTSTPPFVPTPCQQGVALLQLPIPAAAPVGFLFRLQSAGVSNSGTIAFGPALEATIS